MRLKFYNLYKVAAVRRKAARLRVRAASYHASSTHAHAHSLSSPPTDHQHGLRVPPAAQKWPSEDACLRSGRVCFLPLTKPRLPKSVKELLGGECEPPNTSSSFQNRRDGPGKVEPTEEVSADTAADAQAFTQF